MRSKYHRLAVICTAIALLPLMLAATAVNTAFDASAIISGTLSASRGGAGSTSGILKANGSGTVSAAVAGTDYQAADGDLTAIAALAGTSTTYERTGTNTWTALAANGVLKGNGTGTITAATAGTDYLAPGGASLLASSGGTLGFTSRSSLTSASDGVLLLTNNAASDFGRLQFGGTTSSFPSIKRVTSSLQCRLADDSGFCNLQTNTLTINGGLTQLASGSAATIASSNINLTNLPTSDPTGTTRLWNNGGLAAFGDFDAAAARTAIGGVRSQLMLATSGWSPTSGTTHYLGCLSSTSTTAALRRIYIPTACTVSKVSGWFAGANACSNEAATLVIRKNNSSDSSTIASPVFGASNSPAAYSNSSVGLALAAGDYIEVKMTMPTFSTAPTNAYGAVMIEFTY